MDIEYEKLGDEKVVISLKDFELMLDIIIYDETKTSAQKEEKYPIEITLRIAQGENPLKLFRKHRKLSQIELSEKSGVPQGLISEIENGKKTGSVTSLKSLADTLKIDIGDLV